MFERSKQRDWGLGRGADVPRPSPGTLALANYGCAVSLHGEPDRLYVAAVVDLFSRRVVGWSMNTAMTTQFMVEVLD